MSKQSGYVLTIKAFIPSPKDDFAKQAAAATLMDAITKAKTLDAAFLEIADILDIKAKYGSKPDAEAAPVA